MKQAIFIQRILSDLSGTTQVLAGLLLICLVFFWGTKKWNNRRVEELAAMFPGPPALPIIGNALEFLNSSPEEILSSIYRLGKTYESPFRFWLGGKLCICISKPEDLQIVLNNSKTLGKDDIYRFLEKVMGTGIGTAPVTVKKWKKVRRAINPSFVPKSLALLQPIFNKTAAILPQQIRRHCSTGVETNLYPYFVCASLDTICETAFGIQTNTQLEENSSFAETINWAAGHVARRMYKPWLHPDFIYERTSYAKEFDEGCQILRRFADHVVEERRKKLKKTSIKSGSDDSYNDKHTNSNTEDGSPTPLLNIIFELNEGESFEFSDKDLTDEVITFLLAASETSALTSSFCILLLAMHPEVQIKVFEEQYNIFGDSSRPVTVEDLSEMKYTEQVLKETLRVFPVFPVFLRSVEAEIKLSYKYAMMFMKTAISSFIRTYDVTTSKKKIEDIKIYSDALMRCRDGWNVKLEPRIYSES